MNRLLFLLVFILTACDNIHNISVINDTEDTLKIKIYPPLSEWTYTLNCLNGFIKPGMDIINGDTTIKYAPVEKSMEYKIFPNSEFILESAEGLPLSESNLMIDRVQIKDHNDKKILNLKNKQKIIQNCVHLNGENEPSETEYEIRIKTVANKSYQ